MSLSSIVEQQLKIENSLPQEFYDGIIFQTVYLTAGFLIACAISPKLWGTMPVYFRPMWYSTVLALLNPLSIGFFLREDVVSAIRYLSSHNDRSDISLGTLFGFILGTKVGDNWLKYKATKTLYFLVGQSVSFFTLDMIPHVFYKTEMIKVYRKKTQYWQIVGHHIISLLLWPYALISNRCVLFILYYTFTELSNPLMNLRGLVSMIPELSGGKLFSNLEYFAGISFTFVRIFTAPILLLLVVPWKWSDCTLFQCMIMMLTVPIPFLLNFYWWSFMVTKFKKKRAAFGGGGA